MTNIYDNRLEKIEEYVKRFKFSMKMLKKTLRVTEKDLEAFLGKKDYEKLIELCKKIEIDSDNFDLPKVNGIQGSAIVTSQETGRKIDDLMEYRLSLTESQIASLYVESTKRQK